jgi:hypothetical protein
MAWHKAKVPERLHATLPVRCVPASNFAACLVSTFRAHRSLCLCTSFLHAPRPCVPYSDAWVTSISARLGPCITAAHTHSNYPTAAAHFCIQKFWAASLPGLFSLCQSMLPLRKTSLLPQIMKTWVPTKSEGIRCSNPPQCYLHIIHVDAEHVHTPCFHTRR